jgi:branched-chain amino acid transport system permease protein
MFESWDGFWSTYSALIYGVGINAMLALSIALTLSCGLLSLANAAFMGIGAYAAATATVQFQLPFELALLLGIIAPVFVALIIGIPTLRLSGVYLAMATLGFGEVVRVIILNIDFIGGPMGLNGIPNLTNFWHIIFSVLLTVFILWRMRQSKVGRAFEAIREDEIAARLMGVNVNRYKLIAFTVGAGIAGLAGGLNAHYTYTIGPNNYAFENAVEILTMAVFGGANSLLGPILGGTILTLLPEVLRGLKDYRLAVNGLVLIFVVLYLPNGIWNANRFKVWQAKRALKRHAHGGSDA